MQDFEKLGAFYLGAPYDLASRRRASLPLLYDSKDLVTHAVCVGMTGSGKTGLCLALLEEAAIDAVPALVIDPKGDLANLMLTFPDLAAADFKPWINEDEAARASLTPEAFAAAEAERWKRGLAEWGQDGERIRRLCDSAEIAVYTPGSNAGRPVSVLRSFAAPSPEVREDGELLRESIASLSTSLLGLVGLQADPLQSREHILLSNLVARAWGEGRDLDLAALIADIQNPKVQKIGVFDLETFYPAKERFALAMALNNLLAAPGFQAWMEGEALDVDRLLFTPRGKPRIAIFSIAHLADSERMFFVSLLLNQTLAWARRQSGTSSLRALLYMDEIAGYVPPVANPPSKGPLLTLMKQARASGLGVVLATQNPVDLDYKGLSNAGTWFIGRLQTERDKARVLDGLEGAAANAGGGFDRASMDKLLSGLESRRFLMSNVHEDAPVVFETRWCLSYLRGPMTRAEIKRLTDARRAANVEPESLVAPTPSIAPPPSTPRAAVPAGVGASPAASLATDRPVLPPEIQCYFLPVSAASPAGANLVYRAALFGTARVLFSDKKLGVDQDLPAALVCPLTDGPVSVDWEFAEDAEIAESDLEGEPRTGASFAPLPAPAAKAKSYETWQRGFATALLRRQELALWRSPTLEVTSRVDEGEREFRLRLAQLAREERDRATEMLRAKYAPKIAALGERVRRAEQQVDVQREQANAAQTSGWLSAGSALLGAFLGRKVASSANVGRAATAARGFSRSAKEKSDVARVGETLEVLRAARAELEAQFQGEVGALAPVVDPGREPLERVSLRPKRTGVTVRACVLVFAPHWVGPQGSQPAWG